MCALILGTVIDIAMADPQNDGFPVFAYSRRIDVVVINAE